MSSAEVVKLLGPPDERGGGDLIEATGYRVPRWLKYNRPEAQLHFTFNDNGALGLITVMRPDWKPGDLDDVTREDDGALRMDVPAGSSVIEAPR
jgi:hypothetical protein